jgi:hypothetical protein
MSYLLKHDSQTDWEMPESLDWKTACVEVKSMAPALERIVGHTLTLDDSVQDASFFADLVAYEPQPRSEPEYLSGIYSIVCIRFSSFGRMFSILSTSPDQSISEATKEHLIDFLVDRQFVYAPEALLDQPYHRPDFISTWWIRYFDYL